MSRGVQGVMLKTLGAKDHIITVASRAMVGPHLVRIIFDAPTLFHPREYHPSAWFRGWFPDPNGSTTLFQRGYTIAATYPDTQQIAVDIVLHEPAGPASTWARNCNPGDSLAITFYGGEDAFEPLFPSPTGYLLMGCMASYPAITAITRIIRADAPTVPIHIVMEAHHPDDRTMPLPSGAGIRAIWVDEVPDGQAFVSAIGGQDYTGWYAWVAGEGLSTRLVKSYLQRECGANKATMHAQAYWIRHKALGTSRDADALAGRHRDHTAPREASQPSPGLPAAAAVNPGDSPIQSPVLAPVKTALILAGIAQAIIAAIQLLPLIFLADLARHFLTGSPEATFIALAKATAIAMAVGAVATSALTIVMHAVDARFAAQLRYRLIDKAIHIPLGWFAQRGSGEIKKVVSDDVGALHYLVTHSVLDVTAAVVTPLLVFAYLLTVQWRLGLIVLLPVVAYVLVAARIAARDADNLTQAQRFLQRVAHQVDLTARAKDERSLYGPDAVVPLDRTLAEMGDFFEDWQRATGPQKILAVMLNRPITVLGLLVAAGYGMVMAGWISAPDLIPFLVIGTSFGGQIVAAGSNVGTLMGAFEAKAGLDLFLGTPELAPAPPVPPKDQPNVARDGAHVVFDQVSFAYQPDQPVLQDLSLSLPNGSFTALVGPSGSGKSTIGHLLARLWDVNRGAITIDGVDIRAMDHATLYRHVAVLLQDVHLIRASVRANIALANPAATDAEIIAVAKAAHIHDEIMRLPDGYATEIGMDRLSGGQRQRIGIARTLLADTPIVILDEATASADPDSEWAIQQGLNSLLQGRTVLMIAHRLATIRHADQIVVLDQGQITQLGTHEELSAQPGRYQDLWHAGQHSMKGH